MVHCVYVYNAVLRGRLY